MSGCESRDLWSNPSEPSRAMLRKENHEIEGVELKIYQSNGMKKYLQILAWPVEEMPIFSPRR
jgi:hypothetical protein